MFEILCQGGCNNDITPVISLLKNIFNLIRFFGTTILLFAGLYNLIIQLVSKKKRSKERKKRGLIEIMMALIIFLTITLGNVIYGTITKDKWDNDAQCWCGK